MVWVRPAFSQGNTACPQPTGADAPAIRYQPEKDENLSEKFDSQILAFLNTTGSSDGLQAAILRDYQQGTLPALSADVVESDLTGDGLSDVLVNINVAYGGGFSRVMAVYGCTQQRYVLLDSQETSNLFDTSAGAPPTRIWSI